MSHTLGAKKDFFRSVVTAAATALAVKAAEMAFDKVRETVEKRQQVVVVEQKKRRKSKQW